MFTKEELELGFNKWRLYEKLGGSFDDLSDNVENQAKDDVQCLIDFINGLYDSELEELLKDSKLSI